MAYSDIVVASGGSEPSFAVGFEVGRVYRIRVPFVVPVDDQWSGLHGGIKSAAKRTLSSESAPGIGVLRPRGRDRDPGMGQGRSSLVWLVSFASCSLSAPLHPSKRFAGGGARQGNTERRPESVGWMMGLSTVETARRQWRLECRPLSKGGLGTVDWKVGRRFRS